MITLIRSTIAAFEIDPRHRVGARALQVCASLMIWFRLATEWRYANYLWGPHGISAVSRKVFTPSALASVLFSSTLGTHLVLAATALAAAALLFGTQTRVATVALLVLIRTTQARLPDILDGGDNLLAVSLPYMCLLLPARATQVKPGARVTLHNVGILCLMTQICIVYFFAGFAKIQGHSWVSGVSLYLINQIDYFSLPGLDVMYKNPWLVTGAAYATMLHQVWFPIAIQTRARLAWIALGMVFHVGIAVVMGLIPFSTIMIGMEFLTLRDEDYGRLSSWVSRAGCWMRSVARGVVTTITTVNDPLPKGPET